MVIEGKPIAQKIYQQIKNKLQKLKESGIIKTLAVILVGNNQASIKYINLKVKKGKELGIKVVVNKKRQNTTNQEIIKIIKQYNQNPNINAIVLQLPLPKHLNQDRIIKTIAKDKDIDGLLRDSPFTSPIAKAVIKILESIPKKSITKRKTMVIIGKGKTAGQPIYQTLKQKYPHNKIIQIDSQTRNKNQLIKKGDIVVSCVGKKNIVNKDNLKNKAVLIGIGLYLENNKLKGDYDEEDIKKIAKYYTKTTGGIGPVNLACLFENVSNSK